MLSHVTASDAATTPGQCLEFLAPAKLISSNQRLHHYLRNSLTQTWRQAAFVYARHAKLRPLQRAHIVIHVGFPDGRKRDINNYQLTGKAIIDGLVDYGLLPDDNDAHLVGPDMRPAPKVSTLVPTIRVDITDLGAAGATYAPGSA